MARSGPERVRRMLQRGVTLVEMLVAMAIALVVVLAATAAFIGSQRLFKADAEAQAVEESLRFAGHVLKSIVRQAGYVDHAADQVPGDGVKEEVKPAAASDRSDLDIVGATDARVSGVGDSYGRHHTKGVNGSDSLRVRFFGRSRAGGEGTEADGSMIDCMGFAQRGPGGGEPVSADRAWSFFYVAEAADKEPELYCKYRAERNGPFQAQPLARGIEVFKVVYGHDANGDGVPEQWLDAEQLEAMAASDSQVKDEWRRVVGLRIGMVARSARGQMRAPEQEELLYPLGTDFSELSFRPPADGRLRRVMTFTVLLRNAMKARAS